jgi:hypothetical protein
MLLSVALFGLFMTGCWLYCLTDAILTPAAGCRGLSKRAWVAVIALTFIGGALAWLAVRWLVRDSPRVAPPLPALLLDSFDAEDPADDDPAPAEDPAAGELWTAADDAAARHPAGRARSAGTPKGPDDDQEFLRALEQAIRRNPPVS